MCYKCAKPLECSRPISRNETCPHCLADVRCCKNCKHYSVGAHYDCKENIEELVVEKERSNFCDWFSLNTSATTVFSGESKIEKAKQEFNSLFGD